MIFTLVHDLSTTCPRPVHNPGASAPRSVPDRPRRQAARQGIEGKERGRGRGSASQRRICWREGMRALLRRGSLSFPSFPPFAACGGSIPSLRRRKPTPTPTPRRGRQPRAAIKLLLGGCPSLRDRCAARVRFARLSPGPCACATGCGLKLGPCLLDTSRVARWPPPSTAALLIIVSITIIIDINVIVT